MARSSYYRPRPQVKYNVVWRPVIELPDGTRKSFYYFMETNQQVYDRIQKDYPGAKIISYGR